MYLIFDYRTVFDPSLFIDEAMETIQMKKLVVDISQLEMQLVMEAKFVIICRRVRQSFNIHGIRIRHFIYYL